MSSLADLDCCSAFNLIHSNPSFFTGCLFDLSYYNEDITSFINNRCRSRYYHVLHEDDPHFTYQSYPEYLESLNNEV